MRLRDVTRARFMRAATTSTPDDILPARRGNRSPWVLALAGATAGILCAGFVAFRSGDAARSQAMMRLRVAAQGATVCAMAITSGVGASELGWGGRGSGG